MSPTAHRPDFWTARRQVNARQAIFHQWRQLEASGCIQNFRIAAGEVEGWREGWFFADSDAYKWLEAAARIQAGWPDPELGALINAFISLLGRAQMADGYLFTYNQIHFPGQRWQNLQIEHELYCHGHLIEAGVSHFESSGRGDLLEIACRAADRIVADFAGKSPLHTPGHEEIEIALLRLHQVTPGDTAYLEMARQFIERRGRTPLIGLSILRQFLQVGQRDKTVQRRKAAYLAAHPGFTPFQIPPGNAAPKPPTAALRWYASALTGSYLQQHAPVRKQTVPVGHAVRFAYFETAAAMLARLSGDRSLLPALEQAWQRMVARRMYVTGGIGALPGLEGFGRDYELDPEYAYAETCAALACLFWNWEMVQLTGRAQYSELFEWQLYNAAAVGMGLDGATYLYNNPLACRCGVARKPWYAVPCCPSNLSRVWAGLERYVLSSGPGGVCVHQYVSGSYGASISMQNGAPGEVRLEISSGLPWDGRVQLIVTQTPAAPWRLSLRRLGWASGMSLRLNGQPVDETPADSATLRASGHAPVAALLPPQTKTPSGDGDSAAPPESATPVAALLSPHAKTPSGDGDSNAAREDAGATGDSAAEPESATPVAALLSPHAKTPSGDGDSNAAPESATPVAALLSPHAKTPSGDGDSNAAHEDAGATGDSAAEPESATPVAALLSHPPGEPTASGYDPRPAAFVSITRPWTAGDVLAIDFDMPVRLLHAHPKVKGHQGKAAVTRGPLVYCLENVDQPGLDIFAARLDPTSLILVDDPNLLGGIVKLQGRTTSGEPLTLIPYFLWGNRGSSQMTVWIHTDE